MHTLIAMTADGWAGEYDYEEGCGPSVVGVLFLLLAILVVFGGKR